MNPVVVIPTYQERRSLRNVVEHVLAFGARVLIVDDSSPDGTGDLADDLARRHDGRVFVLHRPAKSGLGSAYREGFRRALDLGGDPICEMDADGSHRPEDLPRLFAALADADVAIGSRRVRGGHIVGWGPHRHVMSAGAMFVARKLLGLRTRDVTSGFRCYRRSVIEKLLSRPFASGGYAFQEEALMRCERMGSRIAEVPVTFADRTEGRSKLGWKDIAEFFSVMWRLRKE